MTGEPTYNANIVGDDVGIGGSFVAVSRPLSDLGAAMPVFDHGTVVANFASDSATDKSQSASYDLWITDIFVVSDTDPTAEVGTQPIPFRIIIQDTTDSQRRWNGFGDIVTNSHFSFNTPIKIPAGHDYETQINLGGATNLIIKVYINGYEIAV